MMNNKKWYAGDIHQHSHYSSELYGGTDSAPDTLEEIYEFMRSKGLSFGAASDHHNILNHNEWKKFQSSDFIPIISKEISTGNGHVMALNTPEDMIFTAIKQGDEKVRAEFIRICEDIRRLGGIAQLNHPRDRQEPISFPERFSDLLPIFDTMEVWNGSETMEPGTKNGDAFKLWLSLLKNGVYLPATTGSDQHRIKEYMAERMIKTFIYIDSLTRENILGALKKGNSFLTSGPFADIKINGKSYGETVEHTGDITLDIAIESDKEIDKLYIYDDIHEPIEMDIRSANYSSSINYKADDVKWMFFVIGSNTYNKAITNPIFLKKV
jgi:predicted metal-dependent phosphoesterase TrpH